MLRYSTKDLPPYDFRPGENIHPLKSGGHMEFTGEPHSPILDKNNYNTHQEFLYSIDLFNHNYYWEAHVYLEAIWNANKRIGNVADLCKAIIIIAAAGVKVKSNSYSPAIVHLKRSIELLEGIDQDELCGINIKELIITVSHMLSELSKPLPEFVIIIAIKL